MRPATQRAAWEALRKAFVEMLHDNARPIAGELYAALDLPTTRYILQITQGGKSA